MQFGKALQRLLSTIVHADQRYGPVYLAKIDIADGFYRVWIQLSDIPKLGVALPTRANTRALVAFPLALPMGWAESPPYFTVVTETACDLANAMLRQRDDPHLRQEHRLEAVAATPPPTVLSPTRHQGAPRQCTSTTLHADGRAPIAQVDVYVDDFLLMAQTASQRRQVLRATLASIDKVLRLTPDDPRIARNRPLSRRCSKATPIGPPTNASSVGISTPAP
ncbi:hypothetical protein MHU86_12120 [Fragilaria crotonensis]|nr:hypothetical protein MHU86_12120 [Fragilaria crotonensis]